MKTMTVVLVEPGKPARVATLENTLENLQKTVGGLIEALYPFEDEAAIVCNEEGKLCGLPLNRALYDNTGSIYDIVAGTFFVCGLTEDDFGSLTEEQIHRYLTRFRLPEIFFRFNGTLYTIPVDE